MLYPRIYRFLIGLILVSCMVFHVVLAHHEGFHEWSVAIHNQGHVGVLGHHHDTQAEHDEPGYPEGSHHRDIDHPEIYTCANNTDSLDLLADKISFLQAIKTLGGVIIATPPIHPGQLTKAHSHPPPRQRDTFLTTTILLI